MRKLSFLPIPRNIFRRARRRPTPLPCATISLIHHPNSIKLPYICSAAHRFIVLRKHRLSYGHACKILHAWRWTKSAPSALGSQNMIISIDIPLGKSDTAHGSGTGDAAAPAKRRAAASRTRRCIMLKCIVTRFKTYPRAPFQSATLQYLDQREILT